MIIFSFDGQMILALKVKEQLLQSIDQNVELAEFEHRHFPDGETYIRIDSDVRNHDVIVMCQLHRPNEKAIDLLFLSETLRQLGAKSVGLIAPYLSYMRQDKQFQPGECITSQHFSRWLSEHFDWLVTVDPHLHRYQHLEEIYSIPTRVVHATDCIARYVKQQINTPLIIGPDAESEQWATAVASDANCPALVLQKIRTGDRSVEVSLPALSDYSHHQPVLIDDIISTGKTMINAAENIVALGGKAPVCIGVHAVFAEGAFIEMQHANIAEVITCNTITHTSNKIDIAHLLAKSSLALLAAL